MQWLHEVLHEKMLPPFKLPAYDGTFFSWWNIKGRKNLVILLCNGDCPDHWLFQARQLLPQLKEWETELAVVLRTSKNEITPNPLLAESSLHILFDPNGFVADGCELTVPKIVIADRFGAMRVAMDVEAKSFPNEQILDWLQLIETECPECGISTWV